MVQQYETHLFDAEIYGSTLLNPWTTTMFGDWGLRVCGPQNGPPWLCMWVELHPSSYTPKTNQLDNQVLLGRPNFRMWADVD